MRRQRGAATLLVAGLLVVGAVLALAVGDAARLVVARARAAAAADAAALAAAPLTFSAFGVRSDPASAAAAMADANGAELVECRCSMDRSWEQRVVVTVVAVEVDLLLAANRVVKAASAAEFRPVLMGSG